MTDDLKQRLRELSASRKPYPTGAHGQMVGMESYRIVANGFALECIDEAADRIEELEATLVSRDAEIAELVGVLGNVTAHLIAAHSLLSSGGKKAAASDTIFKIMLQDYEKSFEAGRKALAKVRKP
jgi:hypothetical protein